MSDLQIICSVLKTSCLSKDLHTLISVWLKEKKPKKLAFLFSEKYMATKYVKNCLHNNSKKYILNSVAIFLTTLQKPVFG
jgi:hypothetical protein